MKDDGWACLYPLAWRKNKKVKDNLLNMKLDKRLMEDKLGSANGRICRALGLRMSNAQLTNQEYTISWKWTAAAGTL